MVKKKKYYILILMFYHSFSVIQMNIYVTYIYQDQFNQEISLVLRQHSIQNSKMKNESNKNVFLNNPDAGKMAIPIFSF